MTHLKKLYGFHTINKATIPSVLITLKTSETMKYSISLPKPFVNPLILAFLLIVVLAIFPSIAKAHRGAVDENDDCIIHVGYEGVHFTAYTPTLTGAKEYCKNIPQLGPTNFVFDYEGNKLRHTTVEFEITKEPEGTRIFYQKPKIIKTGNFNGLIDFSKYGAGDYLAHVAIVQKDKKLDTHLSFRVGFEEASYSKIFLISITLLVLFTVLFLMIRASKNIKPEN